MRSTFWEDDHDSGGPGHTEKTGGIPIGTYAGGRNKTSRACRRTIEVRTKFVWSIFFSYFQGILYYNFSILCQSTFDMLRSTMKMENQTWCASKWKWFLSFKCKFECQSFVLAYFIVFCWRICWRNYQGNEEESFTEKARILMSWRISWALHTHTIALCEHYNHML